MDSVEATRGSQKGIDSLTFFVKYGPILSVKIVT